MGGDAGIVSLGRLDSTRHLVGAGQQLWRDAGALPPRPLPRLRGRDREGACNKIRACIPPSPPLPRLRGREQTEFSASLVAKLESSHSAGCPSPGSRFSALATLSPLTRGEGKECGLRSAPLRFAGRGYGVTRARSDRG